MKAVTLSISTVASLEAASGPRWTVWISKFKLEMLTPLTLCLMKAELPWANDLGETEYQVYGRILLSVHRLWRTHLRFLNGAPHMSIPFTPVLFATGTLPCVYLAPLLLHLSYIRKRPCLPCSGPWHSSWVNRNDHATSIWLSKSVTDNNRLLHVTGHTECSDVLLENVRVTIGVIY